MKKKMAMKVDGRAVVHDEDEEDRSQTSNVEHHTTYQHTPRWTTSEATTSSETWKYWSRGKKAEISTITGFGNLFSEGLENCFASEISMCFHS